MFVAFALLVCTMASAQTTNFALGTTSLLEGPNAGSDSVEIAVMPPTGTWMASANDSWLHLNQSGEGSTNVVFSFDVNGGVTRSGTLTVAGQTLTVTQAGSSYVAAGQALVLVSTDVEEPDSVAIDNVGNVYVANTGGGEILEWTAASNTVATLVSSLNYPYGLAVDDTGNVLIALGGDNAIGEWNTSDQIGTTLVSSGLTVPFGVAVDGSENVYIGDYGDSTIKEWTSTNTILSTLVSSGLSSPAGVALDAAGNVYIADSGDNAIKEWNAANSNVTTLVSSGLNQPVGLAVDGAGNIYIADTGNSTIKELPHAFVDPTPKLESMTAGSDTLPMVLPDAAILLAPFAPMSDQPWLTISGITNGVVSFAFSGTSTNLYGQHILAWPRHSRYAGRAQLFPWHHRACGGSGGGK